MIKVLNERKHAEKMIKSGFFYETVRFELRILAKYYANIGVKPKKRKELLYDFCEKYMISFNKAKYYKTINSILQYSSNKKNKLLEIDFVTIYKYEFEYIKDLEVSLEIKKIIIALLVLNKINELAFNNGGYFKTYNSFSDVKNCANLNQNTNMFRYLVDMEELGLIRICHGGILELKFLSLIPVKENSIEYTFVDFYNMGYWFEMMNGNQKIIRCAKCNKLIKKIFSKTIYCKECADEVIYYEKLESKIIVCSDCGKEVDVNPLNTKTFRCEECQQEENRRIKREWKKNNGKK